MHHYNQQVVSNPGPPAGYVPAADSTVDGSSVDDCVYVNVKDKTKKIRYPRLGSFEIIYVGSTKKILFSKLVSGSWPLPAAIVKKIKTLVGSSSDVETDEGISMSGDGNGGEGIRQGQGGGEEGGHIPQRPSNSSVSNSLVFKPRSAKVLFSMPCFSSISFSLWLMVSVQSQAK